MKKLMFAALAVAGMSAVADNTNETVVADFKPVVAEKLQISVKSVDPTTEKVASTKINGFVFTDTNGVKQVYTWTKALNTKEPTGLVYEWTAGDGKQKIKTKAGKIYDLTPLGRELKYGCRFDELKGGKKQGKAIVFQDPSDKDSAGKATFMHWAGYGSGSALYETLSTPHKDSIVGAKESISGNIVKFNEDGGVYGTWKMSLDKGTTKLLANGWTVKDVLGKNKVEFWDTKR